MGKRTHQIRVNDLELKALNEFRVKNGERPIYPRKETSGNQRVWVNKEEKSCILELRGLEDSSEDLGVDSRNVKHAWIKSDTASIFVVNPEYDDGSLTVSKIEDVLSRIIERIDTKFISRKVKFPKQDSDLMCDVIVTDSHVGMDSNPKNTGLFTYKYGKSEYLESIEIVKRAIYSKFTMHGIFDKLCISDLGDQQDGFNGFTTRGGHSLPQNMTNAEVFDLCVDTEVGLIIELREAGIAKKIVLRKVVNDNHSGDFGLLIAKTVQKIINIIYNDDVVEVDILTRFLEHRYFGDHCDILTHGKDKQYMKFGLPLLLNDKTIRFINDYIDHYGINAKYIHVKKGDLHQLGYQRTKRFDYQNFMSFAPPSSWVQHNFGDSYSGFTVQVISKSHNQIDSTNYFLDYSRLKH